MEFVKLSHAVLQHLKENGYTILTSVSPISSENPSWIPDNVDITDFFDVNSRHIDRRSISIEKLSLLVIDDALVNIPNDNLIGQVFLYY